jgi:DNA repair photolyase
MCPVLPGLTDARASVEDVAKAAREHGAQFFGANPLRLMPLVKEHYYAFLEQSFPHLLPRYERAYHGVNATEAYQRALKDRIEGVRAAFGFQRDTFREQERPPVGGQLALL